MAVSGEWSPTQDQSRVLLELYRQSVRHLDTRLSAIVRVFEEAGRWDNTLTVITSDHGQSLGEHGMMFHLLRLDEPLVRIPLWLRRPGGADGGRTAQGWASLIDVNRSILDEAGVPAQHLPSARPLSSLIADDRSEPVYTMADGIVWPHIRRRFDSQREAIWDRPMVAAYQGSVKVIATADGRETHAFDVLADPAEMNDLWPSPDPVLVSLRDRCVEIGHRLVASGTESPDSDMESRLRSWGYI